MNIFKINVVRTLQQLESELPAIFSHDIRSLDTIATLGITYPMYTYDSIITE